jgi:polyisoprenoid-binding protein YceI
MFRRHLVEGARLCRCIPGAGRLSALRRLILPLACLCILAAAPLVQAASWNIDPDRSKVQFKVRYMKISDIEGKFARFKGTVKLDERDLTRSQVRITIDAASLNTGVAARDEELRSPNFFDTSRYPTITFVSRRVEKTGNGKLRVRGDLTAHGVTRKVVLNVVGPGPSARDPRGEDRRRASATAQINRRDFNLTWTRGGEASDGLIGDDVAILLEIDMVRGK